MSKSAQDHVLRAGTVYELVVEDMARCFDERAAELRGDKTKENDR